MGDPFNIDTPDNLRWISMTDRLANGDVTKYDEVYNRNYIDNLNTLSLWYFKDKHTEQVARQNALKSKLK